MMFLSSFAFLFVLLSIGLNLMAIILVFRYFAIEAPENEAS
jgi:hypothetical protein